MTKNHIGYEHLLYDKFIATDQHCIKEVARKTNIPPSTLYKYCAGNIRPPVDIVASLYNATKDEDFLNYIIDDTDKKLADRYPGKGEKTILEETLDVSVACGRLIEVIQKALKDKDIDRNEKRLIIKSINKAEKELEDLRGKIKEDTKNE